MVALGTTRNFDAIAAPEGSVAGLGMFDVWTYASSTITTVIFGVYLLTLVERQNTIGHTHMRKACSLAKFIHHQTRNQSIYDGYAAQLSI